MAGVMALNGFQQRVVEEYRKTYQDLWGEGTFYQEEIPDPELVTYGNSFEEDFRGCRIQPVSKEDLFRIARARDIIYIGDFHPLRIVKYGCLEIIKKSRDERRGAVLLMEDFFDHQQNNLDKYMNSKISQSTFRARVRNGNKLGQSSWQGIISILDYAKEVGICVKAINVERPLEERDRFFTRKIMGTRDQHPTKQLMVFTGELHLAQTHLPFLVREELPQEDDLIIYQGLSEIFWTLLEIGQAHSTKAVKMKEGIYCLNNVPPLLKALVQENHYEERREQVSSKQLNDQYKKNLREILKTALGLTGSKWNLNGVSCEDLESLMSYRNENEALVGYKELLKN